MNRLSKGIVFDIFLITGLVITLLAHYLKILQVPLIIIITLDLIGTIPVATSALDSLRKRHINIDLLASVALIFSFLAAQWPSAAFINLMLAFARLFDRWTEIRTKHLIEHLLKYKPEFVRLKQGDKIIQVKTEHVKINDLVVVETGDRVPVDGTVVSGQASLNESSLTGESELVVKKTGDEVYTATLNESGSILIKAEKVGKESRLEKIISLVGEGTRLKSGAEKIADKFTEVYITVVFLGALLLYYFTRKLDLVLSVLLVVCADDIAVTVPLSFTATIARGSQMGILIKGSEVIEKLPKIKTILTDKTGTLTTGKPHIVSFQTFNKTSIDEFNKNLSNVSGGSRHPINRALVSYFASKNIACEAADRYEESPGEGLKAITGKNTLIIGKMSYLEKNGVTITANEKKIMANLQQKGYGLSVLAKNKKLIGLVALEDGVKKNALQTIKNTKKLGVERWIMLTGDNHVVANRVATEIGIDEFHADVSPEEKFKFVKEQKKKPGTFAVIGDGVNDAAALALADVSIAMGSIGSDAAIEAADVALMTDNLAKIPQAMDLGRENLNVIKQTFIIWGITNTIGLILVFAGLLDPSLAAAYNFVTDFIPIVNALKINVYKPKITYA